MKKRIFAAFLAFLILITASCAESGNGSETTAAECLAPSHVDTNNDSLCDFCRIALTVTVDFYAINDLHGKLLDGNSQPGTDELTSFLKSAREGDDHAVFLSSGDMWQGTSESNLTRGKIVTDWMNSLDFVSMTLGNHEFDWGEEYIESNLELADFPFLAINIYDRATDTLADY